MIPPGPQPGNRSSEPATTEPGPRWWVRLLYVAATAAVLIFVGRELIRAVGKLDWSEVRFGPLPLTAGAACFVVQRALTGLTLHTLIRAFGAAPPLSGSLSAHWTASLGRYVPGKVATVAGMVVILRRFGVRGPVGLAAAILSTGLMVIVFLVMGSPLLFLPGAPLAVPAGWAWALAALAVSLVLLHPRVFLAVTNWGLRRLGRAPVASQPNARYLLAAAGLTALQGFVVGGGVWLLAQSVSHEAVPGYLLAVGVATGSLSLGFLAFFTPAGLGVREGVYLAALGPVMGPAAAVLAVAVRVVQILVDVAAGLAGVAMLRRARDRF